MGNIDNTTGILETEHRNSLLLCWKIREGFRNDIPLPRIKKYVDWYWEHHLKHIFEIEEKYIFTSEDIDEKLRKKVLSQHRKLRKLFAIKHPAEYLKALSLIEEELEGHIRFAEKELFNEFMKTATIEQIREIEKSSMEFTKQTWDDPFWEEDKVIHA